MNKPFTLYHSGRLGVPNNCLYPHSVDVVDEASMKKAVSYRAIRCGNDTSESVYDTRGLLFI